MSSVHVCFYPTCDEKYAFIRNIWGHEKNAYPGRISTVDRLAADVLEVTTPDDWVYFTSTVRRDTAEKGACFQSGTSSASAECIPGSIEPVHSLLFHANPVKPVLLHVSRQMIPIASSPFSSLIQTGSTSRHPT